MLFTNSKKENKGRYVTLLIKVFFIFGIVSYLCWIAAAKADERSKGWYEEDGK